MPNTIAVVSESRLRFKEKEYQCAVGRNGFSLDKKEGDGCTPIGTFPLCTVYFRPDKIPIVATGLPRQSLTPSDGWCDDPKSPDYNGHVKLPFSGSFERLWRDDEIYDLVVVIGYNESPAVPGKGSAIFMHIARPDFSATDGCIALAKKDLLEILKNCNEDTKISITTA